MLQNRKEGIFIYKKKVLFFLSTIEPRIKELAVLELGSPQKMNINISQRGS